MKRFFILTAALTIPLGAQVRKAAPANLFTGPYGKNGTWNLYEVVEEPTLWMDAFKTAAKRKDPLGGTEKLGHLVTISSIEENMFVGLNRRGTKSVWIGLTDSELIKGATETGGARRTGWAWVTGEPLTFAHWEPDEPNNLHPQFPVAGEDAVAIGWGGFWNDLPLSAPGKGGDAKSYLIEWDVEAEKPIPGAEAVTPILPPELPPMPPRPKSGNHNLPWHGTLFPSPQTHDLRAQARFKPGPSSFLAPTVSHIYGPNTNGAGWLPLTHRFPPPASMGKFAGRFQSRLKIIRAGLYTIGVHVDDQFACRIGNQRWKSAHGRGGIDPLDPTTLYQEMWHADGFVLGVIELPAGEHPIDVVFANGSAETVLQVFGAPGEFTHEGSTQEWRLLGHQPQKEVPWPGIDESGWTVTWSAPTPAAKWTKHKLQEALLRLKTGKSDLVKEVPQISYHDPDTPGENRFPNPVPFPGDQGNNVDRFIMQATATLIVPADGLYHLGFHSEEAGAIRIKGASWRTKARDASNRAKITGDTLSCEPGWAYLDAQVIGEVRLEKGSYPIEVLYPRNNPVGFFDVSGAPAGYPPRLLRAGGAEITKDHAGITVVGPATHPLTP